jgi:hypothetical protein
MTIADTFMMIMILNGFALSCAYFLAQLVDCRRRHAADAKDKAAIRLLYQDKSSHPQESAGARLSELVFNCDGHIRTARSSGDIGRPTSI